MFEGIDKALGVPSSEAPAESKPLVVAVPTEGVVLSQERIDADLRLDYDSVRKNLKELVESGKVALDGIINVAQEGDSPRAYEVVAQLIKTLSDTNKDLLEMHTKVKAIRKSETTVNNVNNTTVNPIPYIVATFFEIRFAIAIRNSENVIAASPNGNSLPPIVRLNGNLYSWSCR